MKRLALALAVVAVAGCSSARATEPTAPTEPPVTRPCKEPVLFIRDEASDWTGACIYQPGQQRHRANVSREDCQRKYRGRWELVVEAEYPLPDVTVCRDVRS